MEDNNREESQNNSKDTFDDPNEIHGPFYDDSGKRISFKEWFFGGDPVKKREISGPFLNDISYKNFRTVLIIAIFMTIITIYHKSTGVRLYISTIDNFSNFESSIQTIFRGFFSLFIHADFGHLTSNLVLLVPFGWLLKNYFGYVAFPVIAIMGGVITNILTIFFYKQNYYETSLVGASGMVYAMVSQWTLLYLRWDKRYSIGERLLRALGVIMMLLIPTQYSPTTSYLAHGIGFAVGVICALPFLKDD